MPKFSIKLSIFLTFIFFFMFIGYVQASWIGMLAGLIIPLLSFALLPISLVPFAGFPLYMITNSYFLNNILSQISIGDLAFKINLIFGALSMFICIGTSLLTIIMSYVLLKISKLKLDFKNILKLPTFQFTNIQSDVTNNIVLPSFKDVITGKASLNGVIDQVIDFLFEIWNKLDKQIIGSIPFWFGLGIASHDFYWESAEAEVGTDRPTHGTYLGLELAITGINVITWDYSIVDKIKKTLLFYIGIGSCFLGFILTSVIPKGLSRVICHVFWWTGIVLMIYNWFNLIKEKIGV